MGGGMDGGVQSTTVDIGGIDISTTYVDKLGPEVLNQIYTDIYDHDPTAGMAVDMMATLPYSDFRIDLSGYGKDTAMLEETFTTNVTAMKANMLMAPATRENLVFGGHVSLMVFDQAKKQVTDTMPFRYQDCHVQSNLLFGRDALIRANVSPEMRRFLNDKSQYAQEVVSSLPSEMVAALRKGKVELDPYSTIHWPRQDFAFNDGGMSIYKRLIPSYLLEKVLFRGTLTMANRRQSGITHITSGNDEWTPTYDEMNELSNLVIESFKSPVGAVISTRNDVQINDFMPGGDFWRWMDTKDQLNGNKLVAMGISEAFLSGDASYANAEAAISTLLDMLRMQRLNATNCIFYNKVFPTIAHLNSFTREKFKQTSAGRDDQDRVMAAVGKYATMTRQMDFRASDKSKLIIPKVIWQKKLVPNGNTEAMDMLTKLEEKGFPVAFRMMAAAGGMDIDELLDNYEGSIEDQKRIDELKKRASAAGVNIGGGQAATEDGTGGDETQDDSDQRGTELSMSMRDLLPSRMGKRRKWSDKEYELDERSVTGKRKYVIGQDRRQREVSNKIIATIDKMDKERRGVTTSYPHHRTSGLQRVKAHS